MFKMFAFIIKIRMTPNGLYLVPRSNLESAVAPAFVSESRGAAMSADLWRFCFPEHHIHEFTFSRADLPVWLFGTLKALGWCPWQSAVLAVGGGMEDGCLHILDINTEQSIQSPSTNSQVNVFFGVCLHAGLLESSENNLWYNTDPDTAPRTCGVRRDFGCWEFLFVKPSPVSRKLN